MFEGLLAKYDRLLLFDTETTGLEFSRDEIIEFAAVLTRNFRLHVDSPVLLVSLSRSVMICWM